MRPRKPRTVPTVHGPHGPRLRNSSAGGVSASRRDRGDQEDRSVGRWVQSRQKGSTSTANTFDELNPRGSVMSFAWEVFSYTPLLEKWGEVDGVGGGGPK